MRQEYQLDYKVLEEKYVQLTSDALTTQQEMTGYYDHIINEMGQEIYRLKEQNTLFEAQIVKLSNALVGNKSHFSKYIEVKTENLQLQVSMILYMM